MASDPSPKLQLSIAMLGVAGALGAAVISRGGGDKPAPPPVTQIQIVQNQQQLNQQVQVTAPPERLVAPVQPQVEAPPPPRMNTVACVPAPRGLIAWWDAESTEGREVSGRYSAQASGVSLVPGAVGHAWAFDGRGVVEVTGTDAFVPTTGLTVELWVRPRGAQILWTRLVGVGRDNDAASSAWVLGIGSNQGVYFGLFRDGAQRFVDGRASLSDWTHVAATWDGARERVYLNGVLQADTATFQGPPSPNREPLRIGRGHSTDYGFVGELDEISLYDRALEPDELSGIVRAGAAGKCLER